MRSIGLLLILLFFSACATKGKSPSISVDTLLVDDSFSLVSRSKLSSEEAKEDVRALIFSLSNAYGGRRYIDQNLFQNVLENFYKLSNQVSGQVETAQFCESVGKVLFSLPDNHLAARMNGRDCNAEHHSLFAGGLVGPNISQDKQKPWDVTYRIFKNKKIPILSVTSMLPREDIAWHGFIEAVSKLKETAPAIIIDLRGNGGGDDSKGRDMARVLYGQEYSSPWGRIIKSQTSATLALLVNNTRIKIMRLERDAKPVPEYLKKRLEKNLLDYNLSMVGNLPPEKIEIEGAGKSFDSQKAYTKPIYILIDRGCQSSCESIVEAFEGHPHAVTVGENTGGFIHFGNMGQLVLPKSQIIVQMATDFWERRDGKYFEKIGYNPKVRVPSHGDALDVALGELKKLMK